MNNEIDVSKYYERKIDSDLLKWKSNPDKTIAIIGGPRRIGKTYSLKYLGQLRFKDYVVIETQNLSPQIVSSFLNKDNRLDFFRGYVLTNFGIDIDSLSADLLVIFDEIQEHSELKESISYFNKVFDCRFACTGSALWIDDTNGARPTPDYERFDVYPFNFHEFLKIIGEGEDLLINERERFFKKESFPANPKLLKLFRLYVAIGGMPQSIQCYKDKIGKANLFAKVQNKKKVSIASTYKTDLARYGKLFKEPLTEKYREITLNIGKNVIDPDYQSTYRRLDSMGLVILPTNLSDVNKKTKLSLDETRIKRFLKDVGMTFYYLCEGENDDNINSFYSNFVNGKDSDNNGFLFENFVASTLNQFQCETHFKVFKATDESTGEEKEYELDFIFNSHRQLIALEAKSGSDKTHKSLLKGLTKYNKIDSSYILAKSYQFNKANLKKGPNTIPFYALVFLLEELA